MKFLHLSTRGEGVLEKEKAELWAFSAALLPFINYISPSVAKILKDNSFILNVEAVPAGMPSVKVCMLVCIYLCLYHVCMSICT
jgi:hypothetical protein